MKRDTRIDNLKAFLIFAVVFGHSLEFLCGTEGLYGTIRSIIYSFHMPAFVFLSGYLSKYSRKTLPQITVYYLFTYAIFNTLFSLTPWRQVSPFNIFRPQLIYWYLISLLFWRISSPVLSKIRFIVPISILLSLYIGCFNEADRFLSISRTVCFFPFFIVGCHWHTKQIIRISKKVSLLLIMLCFSITAYVNHCGIIPVKMYEYIQSYEATGVKTSHGVLVRLSMMFISFLLIVSLISLTTTRITKIRIVGQNSLMVYVLHIFPIMLLSHFNPLYGLPFQISIISCFALSLIICFVFSVPLFTDIFNIFSERITGFLIEEDS